MVTTNDLGEFKMSEQKQKHITIFQAPYASLVDCGFFRKIYSLDHVLGVPVPAEYYLPVFDGNILCPDRLPDSKEQRAMVILEQAFSIFNAAHPCGYCGRSMSVGDVVKLEEKYYLCAVQGFQEVAFDTSKKQVTGSDGACLLLLPDGSALRAVVQLEDPYQAININLVTADGTERRVCFVEHNPNKAPGQELCIGVYCAGKDDTVFYDSYVQSNETTK